jgi:hypothetical protein
MLIELEQEEITLSESSSWNAAERQVVDPSPLQTSFQANSRGESAD